MRLLTGELEPDGGSIIPADKLRVVNFTQHREDLDPTQGLRDALCPVGDTVYFQDKPMHVSAWAKRFLFDPSKFRTSVGDLSGGEQARILIARLMLQPADLLILDEPTNDLDIPTLEVLEESLANFPGAIVLVTHDRFMLRRLCTDLIGFNGEGYAKPYVSYAQWEADQQRSEERQAERTPTRERETAKTEATTATAPESSASKKLSYKLQRELDQMEGRILNAEAELQTLQDEAADPKVMADHEKYAEVCNRLGEAQNHVTNLYTRWAELESM